MGQLIDLNKTQLEQGVSAAHHLQNIDGLNQQMHMLNTSLQQWMESTQRSSALDTVVENSLAEAAQVVIPQAESVTSLSAR